MLDKLNDLGTTICHIFIAGDYINKVTFPKRFGISHVDRHSGGTEDRTLITWLRARYFTIKLYPRADGGIRTHTDRNLNPVPLPLGYTRGNSSRDDYLDT